MIRLGDLYIDTELTQGQISKCPKLNDGSVLVKLHSHDFVVEIKLWKMSEKINDVYDKKDFMGTLYIFPDLTTKLVLIEGE